MNLNPKNLKKILFVIVGLQFLVLALTLLPHFSSPSPSPTSSDNSSFPFIPIWIAIFIPLIVSKNKKAQSPKKQKAILSFLVALALGVLVAMITFFLTTAR